MKAVIPVSGFGRYYYANAALQIRVQAMLRWIRKRDANKAASYAREAAHLANALFKHGGIA